MSAQASQPSASQPSAKIFTSRCEPDLRDFIPVFHSWIRAKKLDGVLIDVADYSHVHHGPGVLLVAHEAYWGMDETGGRLGMFYKRRRGEPEAIGRALAHATRRALQAAKLVELDVEGVAFSTKEVVLGFEDRLAAPNTPETFAAFEGDLRSLAAELFEGNAELAQVGDVRAPFRARIAGGVEVGLDTLLQRLG
jgi:hypothetical protein